MECVGCFARFFLQEFSARVLVTPFSCRAPRAFFFLQPRDAEFHSSGRQFGKHTASDIGWRLYNLKGPCAEASCGMSH